MEKEQNLEESIHSEEKIYSNVTVFSSLLYGTSGKTLNSQNYDMTSNFGKKILDYNISKIICFVTSKNIKSVKILGTERNTGVTKTLLLANFSDQDEKTLTKQEMDLNEIEHIENIRYWREDKPPRVITGFEISTNRKIKKFGYGDDGSSMPFKELADKKQIVVGFGFSGDQNNGITAIGCYYLNNKEYTILIYSGILYLKIKMKKNEEFKKQAKEKSKSDPKMEVLYKVCELPDNEFFGIIKYAFD